MNLVEVTQLINHPEVQAEPELVEMYVKKRQALVDEINEAMAAVDAPAMTLKEMLLTSPNPQLAETV